MRSAVMEQVDGYTAAHHTPTGRLHIFDARERQLMRGMSGAERLAFAEHLVLLEDERP